MSLEAGVKSKVVNNSYGVEPIDNRYGYSGAFWMSIIPAVDCSKEFGLHYNYDRKLQ
jgi:hypothetical protein